MLTLTSGYAVPPIIEIGKTRNRGYAQTPVCGVDIFLEASVMPIEFGGVELSLWRLS